MTRTDQSGTERCDLFDTVSVMFTRINPPPIGQKVQNSLNVGQIFTFVGVDEQDGMAWIQFFDPRSTFDQPLLEKAAWTELSPYTNQRSLPLAGE